jgi:hypothetical protein
MAKRKNTPQATETSEDVALFAEARRLVAEARLTSFDARLDQREQIAIAEEARHGQEIAGLGRARRESFREQILTHGETGRAGLLRAIHVASCRATLAYIETGRGVLLFNTEAIEAFAALIELAVWNPRAERETRDLIRAALTIINERNEEIAAEKERWSSGSNAEDWTRRVTGRAAHLTTRTENRDSYSYGAVEEEEQARYTAQTPRRESHQANLAAKWFALAGAEAHGST